MVDLNVNNEEYTLRAKVFKAIGGTQLLNQKSSGVLYCKIISPLTFNPVVVNGILKEMCEEMTIETLSVLKDLKVDDFIFIKAQKFRIERISKEIISDTQFSSRPSVRTQIVLVK